jgi:hypothetical protein
MSTNALHQKRILLVAEKWFSGRFSYEKFTRIVHRGVERVLDEPLSK